MSYPDGYNGQQVCPYTEGVQFLQVLGMQDNNWFKWIDLVVVVAYAILYSGLMYFFLSTVHYDSRLADPASEKRNNKRAKKAQKAVASPDKSASIQITGTSRSLSESNLGASSAKKDVPIGCYVQWKDLCYDVDVKKDGKKQKLRLLKEINGYVKPGMLLALMGPSGAGKSTLLDVLANRKTGGYTKGQILINGAERTRYFTRISAYVEQLDILPPTQTVRESVQFSAKSRLPQTMPMEEKMAFVENILQTLNLVKISNRLIGEGVDALSLSQRKRVNIAIELASDPQLLFLDEPTSGLDSSSALKVMNLIKKIASSGRSIICTIHQPSTSIFKKFDHLLLLKKGGETVYFGPTGENSSVVLDYFAKRGLVCDPLKNPADFILDVTDEAVDMGNGNVFHPVRAYEESELNASLKATIDAGIMPTGTRVPTFHGVYSSSMATQTIELLKRGWYAQVRRIQNLRTRMIRSVFLGAVFGTLFLQLGNEQEDIYSRTSLIFFSLVFGGMSATAAIPLIATERGVFYREQSSGMYRIWIYMLTFIIADVPFIFLSALAYTIPAYFIAGLKLSPHGQPFFFNVLITFIVYFCFQMIAMLFACIFPTVELASALIGVILSLTALFAGFIIPSVSMPEAWKWAHHIDFITYSLESALVNEFQDLPFECTDNKGAVPVPVDAQGNIKWFCPVPNGNVVLDRVEYKIEDKFSNIGIQFAFGVFFMILIYIALRFIRHQLLSYFVSIPTIYSYWSLEGKKDVDWIHHHIGIFGVYIFSASVLYYVGFFILWLLCFTSKLQGASTNGYTNLINASTTKQSAGIIGKILANLDRVVMIVLSTLCLCLTLAQMFSDTGATLEHHGQYNLIILFGILLLFFTLKKICIGLVIFNVLFLAAFQVQRRVYIREWPVGLDGRKLMFYKVFGRLAGMPQAQDDCLCYDG
ncbi:ABC transporter G family protein [Cavenderia fasciculata]|uniref:ABC transporter G family protein n=1 Tax=Cavenderia fasciculata TaxID=261658 RepID=F4PZX3_CACFS|nr:ABC transporter G family protein [Cavenderia fasciculata]EGG18887.1 ABC transporter G family protein [Cavenderia fasciculata]|eukprot:XP_004357349.1 ABC transporter G family protein [Cavenderia fasciculata]